MSQVHLLASYYFFQKGDDVTIGVAMKSLEITDKMIKQ